MKKVFLFELCLAGLLCGYVHSAEPERPNRTPLQDASKGNWDVNKVDTYAGEWHAIYPKHTKFGDRCDDFWPYANISGIAKNAKFQEGQKASYPTFARRISKEAYIWESHCQGRLWSIAKRFDDLRKGKRNSDGGLLTDNFVYSQDLLPEMEEALKLCIEPVAKATKEQLTGSPLAMKYFIESTKKST